MTAAFAMLLALFGSLLIATAFVIIMGVFSQTAQLMLDSANRVQDYQKQVAKISRELPVYVGDIDARFDRTAKWLVRIEADALVVQDAFVKLRNVARLRVSELSTRGITAARFGTLWPTFFDTRAKGDLSRVVVRGK